ncbi:MAG: 30S ribosomal protein S4 [Bacteroidetes bacterium GWF2_43_63]|nr:MAG: 30S ribosomal protein S4 [Bacteroidetes bacterium GWE2_42_42]OFY55809.1 MAG: 30S ribosomal protein S4 [Bacteroidetes bacterium GWF2_43_63]HBG71271.1 30S ribosomal protein S4 [Bacteroidales bacterium]HCB60508.1 30S ribosomal protein S4 [Bacteroidales bacterium]HCY22535.1 30S ribosomal protein S4 [Bacteroidales bacterium]
MARYIGPKSRIARKFQEPIYGHDKFLEKKKYPPGMHGQTKRRRKVSEYGVQLAEKQKAKYTYGILERQFKKLFLLASTKKGVTGEKLLQFIESRLDNTVYRLGIGKTRDGARQLVSHKHIEVNGKVVNVPSYLLKVGDVVSVREKSKNLEIISDSLSGHNNSYSWLEWDGEKMSGKFLNYPEREAIPENINEQLIVELYNK